MLRAEDGTAALAAEVLSHHVRLAGAAQTAVGNAVQEVGGIASLVELLRAGGGSEAAAKAAAALQNLAAINQTNKDAIQEAGGIAPLVELLRAGSGSEAATLAAGALWNLANGNQTNKDAIREAGGIAPLVELLRAGSGSEAATQAAGALMSLAASNQSNQDAIREAGGIAPLVELLRAGGESKAAAQAAGALWNLANNNQTNKDAIREAGGIAPLVELLRAGGESEAATNAAEALRILAHCNPAGAAAVLAAAAADGAPSLEPFSRLLVHLQQCAEQRLVSAEAGDDAGKLLSAIEQAAAVKVGAPTLEGARSRLAELEEERARQAKRESFGLGGMKLPEEFECPITFDKMRDPVVASDGNTYERVAIEAVLATGNGLSPMTREQLKPDLFPNRNLLRRIREYEGEMLAMAEHVAKMAVAADRARVGDTEANKRQAEGGASGSGGGRPKRARR